MKLSIDYDRCCGHGRCYALMPDLFVDDERGFVTVVGDGPVPRHLEDEARRAVRVCPESAIALEEDD